MHQRKFFFRGTPVGDEITLHRKKKRIFSAFNKKYTFINPYFCSSFLFVPAMLSIPKNMANGHAEFLKKMLLGGQRELLAFKMQRRGWPKPHTAGILQRLLLTT
jgi:hypothetical protein